MGALGAYRTAAGLQAVLVGTSLVLGGAPVVLVTLVVAFPLLQAWRTLRGAPVETVLPILGLGGLAALAALVMLREQGVDGWIVLALVFAGLASAISIAPLTRGGAMLSLLAQLVALLLLQLAPDAGAAQAQILLASLPLFALEWTWLAIADSQRLARRPRVVERRLRVLAAPRASHGFLAAAAVVVALFVVASGTIYLLLPRAYPDTGDRGEPEGLADDSGPESERYAATRFPDTISMGGSLTSGVPSFVASVRLRRQGAVTRLPSRARYWKLMTYANYEDGRWSAEAGSAVRRDEDDEQQDGRVTLARAPDDAELIQQIVKVAPLQPQVLPTLDPVQAIAVPRVWILEGGSLVGEAPLADARGQSETYGFTAWSGLFSRGPGSGERAMHNDSRYFQRPASSARVATLAREIAGHLDTDRERVDTLAAYLRTRYEYRRAFEPIPNGAEAIDYFLFVRRTGHCELFAGALALMLRSLGVPARLVGGFQGGQWEEFGAYYLLRSSDAHAWVEVHYVQAGWTRVDPTPVATATETDEETDAAPIEPEEARAHTEEDPGAGMHWAARLLRLDARERERLLEGLHAWYVLALGALLLLGYLGMQLAAATTRAFRATAGAKAPGEDFERALPQYLRDALRVVAVAGHTRAASETLVELEARVALADPNLGVALAPMGEMYRAWRYAGAPPPTPESAAAALAGLERAVRTRRNAARRA